MGASLFGLNDVFVPIKSHLISDRVNSRNNRGTRGHGGERGGGREEGHARDYWRPKFHRGVTWRRKNRRCTHEDRLEKPSRKTRKDPRRLRGKQAPSSHVRAPPTPSSFRCNVSDYTVFRPCLCTYTSTDIFASTRDRTVSTTLFRGETRVRNRVFLLFMSLVLTNFNSSNKLRREELGY